MAKTTHQDEMQSELGHRADEIHVHHIEKRGVGIWPWLILLALGFLALWGLFGRRGDARPMVSPCDAATMNFAVGSTRLTEGDRATLSKLATCLKGNSARKVRLEGRAAPNEGNLLAQSRADAIARELRSLGVPASQFSVGVAGIACADETDACSARNRSVTATPVRRR
ncbi:MAG: OmpA family protein [Myxococcales bacterium]